MTPESGSGKDDSSGADVFSLVELLSLAVSLYSLLGEECGSEVEEHDLKVSV